jgi:hypothetical protein
VTAHNNAGFSIAEYEFATLTSTGGKKRYTAREKKKEKNYKIYCTVTVLCKATDICISVRRFQSVLETGT